MVTLSVTKPLQLKTADGVIERLPGEQLHVDDINFAINLHTSGKATISTDVDMVELMQELLRIDRQTDSSLYIDERIKGSEAVVKSYQAQDTEAFIKNVVSLIRLYTLCLKQKEKPRQIFCDGSGDNGKTSGYCVIIGEFVEHRTFEERYTNNESEWMGMIRALELSAPGDTIYSDSQLIVAQLTGKYQVKEPRLIPLAEKGNGLLKGKPEVAIKWIPREQNLAGHYLERNKGHLSESL